MPRPLANELARIFALTWGCWSATERDRRPADDAQDERWRQPRAPKNDGGGDDRDGDDDETAQNPGA